VGVIFTTRSGERYSFKQFISSPRSSLTTDTKIPLLDRLRSSVSSGSSMALAIGSSRSLLPSRIFGAANQQQVGNWLASDAVIR